MRFWSALSWRASFTALSACGGDAPASSSGVFKIGVVLPLTGSTAWGGRPARIAAELAAREVNEQHLAGDYRLELEFADGACAPRTAYAAADKLISQDRVGMLIGEWCSSASIAAAQVANDAKVPMLVQISTADGIARNAGAYVFQAIMQNSVIQEREATLLLEKFRFKTVAILVENNDFGLSFRDNMRRSLERAGVRVVLDVAQDRQDANWYSIITRIKGAGAGPGRRLHLRRSGGDVREAIRREQSEDAAVFRLHAAAVHLREAGRGARRPHRPRPRHVFRRQSRGDGPPEGVRGRASSRWPSARPASAGPPCTGTSSPTTR